MLRLYHLSRIFMVTKNSNAHECKRCARGIKCEKSKTNKDILRGNNMKKLAVECANFPIRIYINCQIVLQRDASKEYSRC
jgi:hypothetical protein